IVIFIFYFFFFFFFQAEDGIRDLIVTGVQTCALPILTAPTPVPEKDPLAIGIGALGTGVGFGGASLTIVLLLVRLLQRTEISRRSEERRVGKECRSRGWGCR